MIRLIACLCLLIAVTWANADYCEIGTACKEGYVDNSADVSAFSKCFQDYGFAIPCAKIVTAGSGNPPESGPAAASGESSASSGSSTAAVATEAGPDLDECDATAKSACGDDEVQTGTCMLSGCERDPNAAYDDCERFYCSSNVVQGTLDTSEFAGETTATQIQEVEQIEIDTTKKEASARSFNPLAALPQIDQYGRPRPDLCALPKPFPRGCRPSRHEPYVRDAPHQIPYCQRIPCQIDPNLFHLKLEDRCIRTPGCYFDRELYSYRKFIPKIYPGVPVCHLAIRNSVFLAKAKLSPRWHPLLTNCLINTFSKEIFEDKKLGCTMLPMLRAFGFHAKMGGWKNIQKSECILSCNGCWEEGRGCYYEMKSNMFNIKSRQFASNNRRSQDEMYPYGRAKCQHFDTTNPRTIISSIHKCYAAGCTVDKRVMKQYPALMFHLGRTLPAYAHHALNKGFMKGEITPQNVDAKMAAYVEAIPQPDQNAYNPFDDPALLSMIGSTCGDRPCPPKDYTLYGPPGKYLFPRNCPYRPIPFPLPVAVGLKSHLQGPLTGCCDAPALCYFPKAELSLANSGASSYVTEWSDWGECSKRCGGGIRRRYRACVTHFGGTCEESVSDEENCNMHPCPYWGKFSSYGSCSRSCGVGQQERRRRCHPNNNPNECAGLDSSGSTSTRTCNTHSCTSRFGPYGLWEKSCEPCGTHRIRTRKCTAFANPPCHPSELEEVQKCQYQCGQCSYPSPKFSSCQYVPNPYGGKDPGCYRVKGGTCSTGQCKPEKCVVYRKCSAPHCQHAG